MIGQKFNKLLVLKFSHSDKWRSKYFLCQCDCGGIKTIKSSFLRNGKTKSCGCLQKENCKLIAKTFNSKRTKIKCSDFIKTNIVKQFSFKEDYNLNIRNFIYKFTNLINNKIYIGKTQRSLKVHLQRYYSDSNNKRLISRAISKYGFNNFYFEILYVGNQTDNLSDIEIKFIDKYQSNNLLIGYNLTIGGEGLIGYKKTKEQLLKQSNSMRGKFKGSKNPFFGKKHSIETRLKIIESNKRRAKK